MAAAGSEVEVHPEIADADPSGMIEHPGAILRWIFNRYFRSIEFPAKGAEQIRAAAENGAVVYVCTTASYVDYLYFTFALLRHGLPLAKMANGVSTLLLQPLGGVLRALWNALFTHRKLPDGAALMAERVAAGQSALVFLRQPQTALGWWSNGFHGPYVEALMARQKTSTRPIVFVPLTLLWGSPAVRSGARRGFIDWVFGDREAPGFVRSLWTFFNHFSDSQVLVGEPLQLPEFLAAHAELPLDIAARRLRWTLGGRLEAEVRVVRGPQLKSARRIRTEVLRGRRLVGVAKEIAADEKIPVKAVAKRADKMLKEIAADPKPWAFALAEPLLRWVWRRIFDGLEVDLQGLDRVRSAARRGPLLLVPSHKSHVDYLVLAYLFVVNDLVPPHIAAGANLSFWPMGWFFRRCCAFFLRRSFRGEKLYGAVFRAYVQKLLREGISIEFFIEGGRSRTGKLLSPKLGLLGMIVDAALEDGGRRARQAQIVPISIGYDKVVEERSYARELAGGEKKKEDVKGLLKATRVLWGQYGRVNVQFGEPLPLGPTLRQDGAMVAWDEDDDVVVPADDAARRQATQKMAYRIVYGINRVTAVTPTSLAASALLASGKRGVTREALLDAARFLVRRATKGGGRLGETLLDDRGNLDDAALDRALDLLGGEGDIEVRSTGGAVPRTEGAAAHLADEIYTVPDERRGRLAFYRNNAIHLFVAESLVCLAHLAARGDATTVSRTILRTRTLELSRLLKLEFIYRVDERFETIFDETLAQLVTEGLFTPAGEDIALVQARSSHASLLAGLVVDFVESYGVVARALQRETGELSQKELLRRIAELGDKLYYTGEVRRREACISATYQTALAYYRDIGLIEDKGGKVRVLKMDELKRTSGEIAALCPLEI